MRHIAVILCLAGVIGLGSEGIAVASAKTAHAARVVPVVVVKAKDGEALVGARVVIHGRPFAFLIDTGASRTLVTPAVARQLHLKSAGKSRKLCGVNSCSTSRETQLRNWNIGGQALPRVVADVAPIAGVRGQLAGLLGSDVLSKFGSITINYRDGTLALG